MSAFIPVFNVSLTSSAFPHRRYEDRYIKLSRVCSSAYSLQYRVSHGDITSSKYSSYYVQTQWLVGWLDLFKLIKVVQQTGMII